jgi:methylase of polypeptide subunit release factors
MSSSKKTLKDIYVGVNQKSQTRNLNDFYQTPPVVTYILTKYTNVPKVVSEPCAGRGSISIELKRQGHEVISTDLYFYENPLVDDIQTNIDVFSSFKENINALVTNPPYYKQLPEKIYEFGCKNYEYTALFVRLTFLEGKRRKLLFQKYKPTNILIFSDRVRFINLEQGEPIDLFDQVGGMICYMWIIHDRNSAHVGRETKCEWVSITDEFQEWKKTFERNIK